MRRENVQDVCVNQVLIKDLVLHPFPAAKSKGWCCRAIDYASKEKENRQFALKFASKYVALDFRKNFETARDNPGLIPVGVKTARQQTERGSHSIPDPAKVMTKATRATESEECTTFIGWPEVPEPEDIGHFGARGDDVTLLFSDRATLSYLDDRNTAKTLESGEMQVLYDSDFGGALIQMVADNGRLLCNHVICRQHTVKLFAYSRICVWVATDYSTDQPSKQIFRVQFRSPSTARKFSKVFNRGLIWANESKIDEISENLFVFNDQNHGFEANTDDEYKPEGATVKEEIGADTSQQIRQEDTGNDNIFCPVVTAEITEPGSDKEYIPISRNCACQDVACGGCSAPNKLEVVASGCSAKKADVNQRHVNFATDVVKIMFGGKRMNCASPDLACDVYSAHNMEATAIGCSARKAQGSQRPIDFASDVVKLVFGGRRMDFEL